MTLVEQLKAARELIQNESRWAIHYYAKDEYGRDTDARAANACSWCAIGALRKVAEAPINAIHLLNAVCVEKHLHAIPTVNDMMGHRAVLELYDLAIEKAENEAKSNSRKSPSLDQKP